MVAKGVRRGVLGKKVLLRVLEEVEGRGEEGFDWEWTVTKGEGR